MTTYKIGILHDLDLEDLDPFDPQPRTEGLKYENRSYAASGDVYDELPFVEFKWNILGSKDQLQAILALAGLTSVRSTPVTVYVQNEDYDWVLRNGTAVRPFIGRDGRRENYFLRDFVLIVHSLRAQV